MFWPFIMIDAVSEIYRANWEVVTNLPIIEFLSIYSYMIMKNDNQRALIEQQIKRG